MKVIDLFAGPGGLGEGFSAFRDGQGQRTFRIALSVEKEASAHRTLTLRALFRQFDDGSVPEAYYAFLRGELGRSPEDHLYQLPEVRSELEQAQHEAQRLELGITTNRVIYNRVSNALAGEEFVLIGGPPCQAYSLVGRSRNAGDKTKEYDPDADHRNFLYKEYLRTIAKFQPLVFVMENVKGMLSAKTSKGPVFPRIVADLQDPGKNTRVQPEKGRSKHKYRICSFVAGSENEPVACNLSSVLRPRDFVVRSEDYGIPQARHRVILLGIREDLADRPTQVTLKPLENQVSVQDVIAGLPRIRSGLSKQPDDPAAWGRIPEETMQVLEHSKRGLPEGVLECIKARSFLSEVPTSKGHEFGSRVEFSGMPVYLKRWYSDPGLGKFVTNHSARGHIKEDLARYWFAATFQIAMGRSPKAPDFPEPLWPEHANFHSGKFADRFRVQGWNTPSTTVTSHISKDGHYFIHPDPSQMRSLTVREAARLQTFPDNYHFVGNRTQQYVQVGNAVPPLLAVQLANVVSQILETAGT